MCKIYGYCRISRKEQSIDRQVRNITDYNKEAHIIQEAYTGTKFEGRTEFNKLLKIIKPGDTIIFDSVSRMSRNASEGTELYFNLFDQGVNLIFLKERYINTDTYKQALNRQINVEINTGKESTDKFINKNFEALNEFLIDLAKEQIQIAFDQAEKEVEDLHQRTREGIETARLNGKQIGQKPGAKLNIKKKAPQKELIKKYSKDFNGSLTDAEAIKQIGISRNTYYKYKSELKKEAEEPKESIFNW